MAYLVSFARTRTISRSLGILVDLSSTDAMTALGPPPEGDVNQGPGIIGTLAATTSTCIMIVALRFWVRGRIMKAIGWDDWTILLALV